MDGNDTATLPLEIELQNVKATDTVTSGDDMEKKIFEYLKTFESSHKDFKILDKNVSNTYTVLYYLLRFFTIIMVYWVFIITLNYSIGQIFEVKATNVFCDDNFLSFDAVYQYNYNRGSQYGIGNNCYYANRLGVDYTKLDNVNSYDVVKTTNAGDIFVMVLFLILSLYFVYITTIHFYYLMYDLYYHCKKKSTQKLVTIMPNVTTQKRTMMDVHLIVV